MIARAIAIGAGAYLLVRAFVGSRRSKPIIRVGALDVSLREDRRWADDRPSVERVDEYLAGVQPHGRDLVLMNTATSTVNFCAAAVGWTEHEAARAGARGKLPPWRSGAKQIMFDAQDGLRGPWVPRSRLSAGWLPPPGAVAVYHRGEPGAPTGHVDRVISVTAGGFNSVGANEEGRRWDIDFVPFTTQALLGFVVDGEAPEVAEASREARPSGSELFVEPPLTRNEWKQIRGM